MKRNTLVFATIFFIFFGLILGFSYYNGMPDDKPNGSKSNQPLSKSDKIARNKNKWQPVVNNGGNQTLGTPYYTDNFDGANDTTSLKSRGYKVYYRGSGPQGTAATWFQGNPLDVFPAYNGPANGYVAANHKVVTGINNINSWLVLPKKNVTLNDSIIFYCRSTFTASVNYPDSVRVMYSASGDSIPEAGSWVELGRFKAQLNSWQRKGFRAPSTGANARYAIRYAVVNGGPAGTNSDYIGIDALTLQGPSLANDVSTLLINTPTNFVVVPTSTIAPKATFGNVGTSNQTNIPVTYKITGPVNYTSTKTIASLTAGSSLKVNFDSTFVPLIGTYTVSVYTGLVTDANRANDTLKTTFRVINANYGSGNGYFYSNSVSTGAPSKPLFCWKDTTGSKSLIVNKTIIASGIFTGDLDDGYFRLGNILGAQKKIRFGGVNYDSVFIGTNGLIGFSRTGNPFFQNFTPDTGIVEAPAFYPLWCDLDYSDPDATINRLSYKVINNYQLLISYDRATIFEGGATDYVSFQVIIDIVESSYLSNSRLLVQFADASNGRTGSGFIAKYNSNTLPTVACGLATSSTNKLFYRFSSGGTIIFPGPFYSSSIGVAVQFGPDATKLNNACSVATLNLTASLEAVTPNTPPSSNTSDTISVLLRETTSPFEITDVDRKVLSAGGICTLNFTKLIFGRSYYVVVKHRNSIETWSKFGVLFPSANVSYDFTTGVNKAFGDNMIIVDGEASMYAGDVNQDGVVDLSDGSLIDNDIFNFVSGYVNTDVNHDNVVDITDAVYVDNNSFNFVGLIRP